MKLIGVATANGRAYYSIVARLKQTNLKFVSLTLAEAAATKDLELIITTKQEAYLLPSVSIPIEELHEDPLIMEGQILSRMLGRKGRVLLIGIDPGSRIGVAAYFCGIKLGSLTINSMELLERKIIDLVLGIPHDTALIRIGDGYPRQSLVMAERISARLSTAIVEIVDEKGTSFSSPKGLARDQSAAAKIAFRKGVVFK